MKSLNFHIRGISPTILHNGQLSDPSNKWSRLLSEETSKDTDAKKVDANIEARQHIEWLGSLYLNNDQRVIWPGENIIACIVGGSNIKARRKFKAAVDVIDDSEVIYKGPKDLEELWKDPNFRIVKSAKVGKARIIRCRPIFRLWELKFVVMFNELVVSETEVKSAVNTSGISVGLSDWRPRFGRFEVLEVTK